MSERQSKHYKCQVLNSNTCARVRYSPASRRFSRHRQLDIFISTRITSTVARVTRTEVTFSILHITEHVIYVFIFHLLKWKTTTTIRTSSTSLWILLRSRIQTTLGVPWALSYNTGCNKAHLWPPIILFKYSRRFLFFPTCGSFLIFKWPLHLTLFPSTMQTLKNNLSTV